MSSEAQKNLWERMEGEPNRWFQRFERYRLMGNRRSVNAVFEEENKEKQGKTSTKIGIAWYSNSKQWNWDKRAAAWDKHLVDLEEERIKGEREKVFNSRYALDYKRIEQLDRVAQKLLDWVEEEEKVWVPETKTIISKEEKVYINKIVFNHHLFQLIDKYFDSIAEEKGERIKTTKQEITGKDGDPIEIIATIKERLKQKLDAIKASESVKVDKEQL